MKQKVVIVGAGCSGRSAVRQLRKSDQIESLVVIDSDGELPYDRPNLSKLFLQKDVRIDDGDDADDLNDVEFIRGVRVDAIHREGRALLLSNGAKRTYDKLLLVTGASARVLDIEGMSLENVHTLRDIGDCRSLKKSFRKGRKLIVIGGGLIGLEVAASAVGCEMQVTVVETGPRLLARISSPLVSDLVQRKHEESGVEFVIGASVIRLVGTGEVNAVELSNGTRYDCDAVLVAVGATPNTSLATQCGLDVDDGIDVNADFRTSDVNIFAAGDVARVPHGLFGCSVRLEHWHDAGVQGQHAADAILGQPQPYVRVPWFWSDQYNSVLQIAGLPKLGQRRFERTFEDGTLCVFLVSAEGILVAASAFGDPAYVSRAIGLSRRAIAMRLVPSADIANEQVELRGALGL